MAPSQFPLCCGGYLFRNRPALYRDGAFWWALALGPAGAWLLLSLPDHPVAVDPDVFRWERFAWLVLLYPALEEWLFRGVIQRTIYGSAVGRRGWRGLSVANGATTLLFAMAHLLSLAPLWSLLVAVPSLLFGWFRDRYDSLLPGLILHSGYNLAYFVLLSHR